MRFGLQSKSATPIDFETLTARYYLPVCPKNGTSSTEIHLPIGSIQFAKVNFIPFTLRYRSVNFIETREI